MFIGINFGLFRPFSTYAMHIIHLITMNAKAILHYKHITHYSGSLTKISTSTLSEYVYISLANKNKYKH